MFFTFIELILFILSEGYVPIACQKEEDNHNPLIINSVYLKERNIKIDDTLSKWKGIIYFEKQRKKRFKRRKQEISIRNIKTQETLH